VCHTQELLFNDNKIGDAGMIKFSEACAGGALPNLTDLQLGANEIGDEGMIKFSSALANGALPSLLCLDLVRNTIGDVGLSALASACAKGALAQLTVRLLPTALIPCLETWHARSPGLTVSFDVPYVPYAEALPPYQSDWRPQRNSFGQSVHRWGTATAQGSLSFPGCPRAQGSL
jgi:hypothetical protein